MACRCGVDTPMRFWQDWGNIYMSTCKSPFTAKLKWYSILGNHDLPLNSVQNQLGFAKMDGRWVMPARYYALDYLVCGRDRNAMYLALVMYGMCDLHCRCM
jgi:hypothetical protein